MGMGTWLGAAASGIASGTKAGALGASALEYRVGPLKKYGRAGNVART